MAETCQHLTESEVCTVRGEPVVGGEQRRCRTVPSGCYDFQRARAEASEQALAEARFAPLGDNHHNAAACPYCSPRSVIVQRDILQQALDEALLRIDALMARLEAAR